MRYYLGIDGGGTCTTFLLVDEQGVTVSKLQTSTCHYEQVGFFGFQNTLVKGFNKVIKKAGITKNNIATIFAALPGYGESAEAKQSMDEILKQIFSPITYSCGNDVLAGFAGSLTLKSGINILAGTGSLVYGQYEDKECRCGGWGHICGDEGSAYWIGRKVLECFTKQCDGRIAKSNLYHLLKDKLNLAYDFEIVEVVISTWKAKRDKIAELAQVATIAAHNGDENAIKIYEQAAKELALQAKAVLNTLKFNNENTIAVSWSGGVFKAGDIILDPLIQQLKLIDSRCKLQKPVLSPEYGAVLLAKKLTGPVEIGFINNLIKDEGVTLSC